MVCSGLATAFIAEYFRCGERRSTGEVRVSESVKNNSKHPLCGCL